jgi:chitodextrinase
MTYIKNIAWLVAVCLLCATAPTLALAQTSQVSLSWIASTDPVVTGQVTSGVCGYNVFRNGVKIGTSATTSYQDTGLSAATTYTYTVSAYDCAGNMSAQSTSVNVTTSAALPPPPAPPTVSITSPTNGSVINGSVNIAVLASSAVGLASITITADGNYLTTCANATSCSATWQKKKVSRGTHTIGTIAIDTRGTAVSAAVTIVER